MGGLEKAVSSLDPQLLQFSERGRKSTQDELWLAEEQQQPHWLHSSGVMGTTSSESQAILQCVIKLFPSWPNFTRCHMALTRQYVTRELLLVTWFSFGRV